MTKKSLILFLGLALGALSVDLNAQDAHFSQYFSSPLYTNPALIGQINGDFRLNMLYRSQWNAFKNAAFQTGSFSADGRFGRFGLGVSAVDQVSVDRFDRLSFNVGGSYDLSNAHHLVFGVQAGVYSISTGKNSTQPDQYVDGFGAIGANTEELNNLSVLSPDVNFGLLWFNGSSKLRWTPFAGAAVYHLLQPYDSFDKSKKLPMRFLVHGGVRYRTNSNIDFTPNVMISMQETHYNAIAGCNASYQLIDTYTSLEGGLSYRLDDAIVPYLGIGYKDFAFGVTYDVNMTSLSKVGPRKNALEFSLTYVSSRNSVKKQFICPRL